MACAHRDLGGHRRRSRPGYAAHGQVTRDHFAAGGGFADQGPDPLQGDRFGCQVAVALPFVEVPVGLEEAAEGSPRAKNCFLATVFGRGVIGASMWFGSVRTG